MPVVPEEILEEYHALVNAFTATMLQTRKDLLNNPNLGGSNHGVTQPPKLNGRPTTEVRLLSAEEDKVGDRIFASFLVGSEGKKELVLYSLFL